MVDKVQKIREEVKRLMYGFNLEADIASCEDAETEKLANIKYQLCKKILEYINKVQEESVSEDLEEAAEEWDESLYRSDAFKAGAKWQKAKDESITKDLGDYISELSKQFPEVSFAKLSRIAVRVAKWQRQQDNNDANHALVEQIKTQQMCYEKGMADMKRQMMAKAIDGKVIANGMGNPILHLWDKGRHLIDKKVKVILMED